MNHAERDRLFLDLMFWGAWRQVLEFPHVVWVVVSSALPFGGYELEKHLRIRRFEAGCRPLIDRLIPFLSAIEERKE